MVVVAGCGRIAFDPIGGGDDVGPIGDAGGSGDGGDGGGSSTSDGAMPDALTACNNALTIQPLTPMMVSTCAGSNDVIDACGPAGTQEVVFKFVVPASGGYNFRARDAGTQNVSSSTGLLNAGCTATVTCAGILSRAFTAGEVIYFVVEASSGGCVNIEFENF